MSLRSQQVAFYIYNSVIDHLDETFQKNMSMNMKMSLKCTKYAIATFLTGLTGVGLVVTEVAFSPSPALATQQLFCTGRMKNGWSYNAEFLDGRFTQIRWERSGQPPQVSRLTFSKSNRQGQPVYKGSLMGAVAVKLIDLSRGDVRPGSQISVDVQEWGVSTGNCSISSSGGAAGSSISTATVRKNLIGVNQVGARNWLKRNNFFFNTTVEHTNIRVVERWNQNPTQAIDLTLPTHKCGGFLVHRDHLT